MSVVTLAYVKTHLNIPSSSTTNDTELQGVIDAAEGLVADLIGPLAPTSITETHFDSSTEIVLRVTPVITVDTVTSNTGITYAASFTPGGFTYTFDGRGKIDLWSTYGLDWQPDFWWPTFYSCHRSVTVAYTAGRSSLSPKLQYAVAELVKHLWQSQQGSRMNAQAEDWGPAPYAVPNRVKEMLGKDALGPGIG